MAERGAIVVRPIWMKQAEEARVKDEEQKAAAARAAFDATFKDVLKSGNKENDLTDSEPDESDRMASKPVGPIDPSKCVAAGTGIGGGAACTAASFVVVTKDSDGRKMPYGGAQIRVKIKPGLGVVGNEHEAMVKDNADGTYAATYIVGKRGNYMVHVECNGRPIMGSPFPVFFSSGSLANGSSFNVSGNTLNSSYPIQSMPNYPGTTSGSFSGMLGMISGILPGSTMGGLSQMPMAPSAAAMAAAQTIVAAQALQAHAAQAQAQAQSAMELAGGNPAQKDQDYSDVISRTVEVSNLGQLLTSEQVQELFGCCGTVTNCDIDDSKQLAYIEYSKPDEARAALALNNLEVSNRSLGVEMAKSLPLKKLTANSSQHLPLPLMMQQAVAMQQLQFQQALVMQQSMASQQAASRAASMKSATEMASARAAEISKCLKIDGDGNDDKTPNQKSSSPSKTHAKSPSRSRSPIRYQRDRHSRSRSPMIRYQRDRHSRSPLRPRHRNRSRSVDQTCHYRDGRDNYQKYHGRRDRGRPRDRYTRNVWRRSRSQSRTRKSPQAQSNPPRHYKEKRGSPKLPKEEHKSAYRSRRSRSMSKEPKRDFKDNEDISKHHGAYSGKPENKVEKSLAKLADSDVHQDSEVKKDKSSKDLTKQDSRRKNLTKADEGMSKDNDKHMDGRKKSRLAVNDNYTNNMRVCTRSNDILKGRKSVYDSEGDTKEKKQHTKERIMDDDDDFTKWKLHRKEKRTFIADYELEESKLQKREKKALDDNYESKEKKHRRKGNELGSELFDASKQYKNHGLKEEDENIDKRMKKNKHRQRSPSDSSKDSLLEYVDRDTSSWKKISCREDRRLFMSVSPSHLRTDKEG
ncbi:uncharacterized protein LOC131075864 isoform X2 [Cryptomeria japonica]|uniref:uncharacterized protein LOC131075864 isoform X2 n=1 Tax=Cryptomeria japonica TaxID=3369 RepID=UPI0027DA4AB2|nr:uncharacterized protein LOC131075864 isoform X2 [Cryptomeria japonica]